MKIFHVDGLYPAHTSTAYSISDQNPHRAIAMTESSGEIGQANHGAASPAVSVRSVANIKASVESMGSESPRSIRDYHRGSGNLNGGGVTKIYGSPTRPSIKKYKSKLDRRLGVCLFACFFTIASILVIYGAMHKTVHDELTSYVNRTHQIAKELKLAMDENYPKDNSSTIDAQGRTWMTVEELEDDAYLIRETNSTVWKLFWWNVIFCALLTPILIAVHCDMVEGNLAKLVYRVILLICLIFCIAQFLYLVHPVLWGAAKFPGMVDRLLLEAYPKDEYALSAMETNFACLFRPHETLVQFDLQTPCIPKIKNSLLPTYSVVLLIFLCLFPFLFGAFTYAWDACIKNSSLFRTARQRVELNNSRRVPFPKSNVYIPPSEKNAKTTSMDQLPGNMV